MTNYNIELWRGAERIFEYEGDECPNLDDAQRRINEFVQEMMTDSWSEDGTGIAHPWMGKAVLEVPLLATISAIAPRSSHQAGGRRRSSLPRRVSPEGTLQRSAGFPWAQPRPGSTAPGPGRPTTLVRTTSMLNGDFPALTVKQGAWLSYLAAASVHGVVLFLITHV